MLDEVGADVARLTFLLQSIDNRQSFDLAAVVMRSLENPVYYVQYAHARIHSIASSGRVEGHRAPAVRRGRPSACSPTPASSTSCAAWPPCPRWWPTPAAPGRPHKVTTWARELAGRFHGFYYDCYVMGEGVSPELTQARLWLVEATRVGLAIGLDLLGVSAPESM